MVGIQVFNERDAPRRRRYTAVSPAATSGDSCGWMGRLLSIDRDKYRLPQREHHFSNPGRFDHGRAWRLGVGLFAAKSVLHFRAAAFRRPRGVVHDRGRSEGRRGPGGPSGAAARLRRAARGREELTHAGAPDALWKDVVALARPSLSFRRGRYYYNPPVSDRVRQEQSQLQGVRRAVDQLLGHVPADGTPVERRGQDRVGFVQSVAVRTEDGEEFTLLSRDLSTTGIRLVGTRRLLGHKVHVLVPRPTANRPTTFSSASSGPAPWATACSRTAALSSTCPAQ